MGHEKFNYKTLNEVEAKAKELGVTVPLCEDTSILTKEFELFGRTFPNRMGIAPMEGNDSDELGFPTEHTIQRYIDYAEGGASVIWYEAIGVVPEGRSAKHQLMLNEDTKEAFKEMNRRVKEAGLKKNGYEPYLIMQANHSGRYSKPNGYPEPIIAYHNTEYEKDKLLDDSCIATDEYLDNLSKEFGKASKLCKEVGFDAVDIKSCHGYLFAEMASAYTREGRYGGSFENRFRLLLDSKEQAKKYEDENFKVTLRLGIYDGFAYPNGWGTIEGKGIEPDYTEAIQLLDILVNKYGIELINITMGNPYQNSHVTRPFDIGKYVPTEHPLLGLTRMYDGIKELKKNFKDTIIMASAPSYLRHFAPQLAAGAIDQGYCDMVAFGRLSFANPNFPNEIKETGTIDFMHSCITCGKCGDLIRAGFPCGCVVRKPGEFMVYYKEYLEQTKEAK